MVDIKKEHKYKKEQEEILNKLLLILNYNNDYTFYLYDLDNKIELQESIIGLSWIQSKIRPERFCRTSDPDFSLEEVKQDPSVVFNKG